MVKPVQLIPADDPDQKMMSGAKPVSLKERLEWQMQQPLLPNRGQKPLDLGFWNPMRHQLDLF